MFRYFKFTALILTFVSSFAFAEKGVEIEVKLSPAGGYIAKAPVIAGEAHMNGDNVTAEGIEIDLNAIKTGVDLRDKHTKQRLLTDKHPVAKLVHAEGSGGKGKGTIDIRGQKLEVSGTYEVKDGMLIAKFPVSLASLDIKDARYMGVGAKDTVNITVQVPVKEGSADASAATPKKAKKKKK